MAQSRLSFVNARDRLFKCEQRVPGKIAKATSDRQSVLSDKLDTETSIQKLENQLSNYKRRRDFLYILAPQAGLVNEAIKPGIGETVKEGEAVVKIATIQPKLAVEMYIRPVDIPLVKLGAPIRLQFDGWPAITFGGGMASSQLGNLRRESICHSESNQ